MILLFQKIIVKNLGENVGIKLRSFDRRKLDKHKKFYNSGFNRKVRPPDLKGKRI
jgi:hypothetical protein